MMEGVLLEAKKKGKSHLFCPVTALVSFLVGDFSVGILKWLVRYLRKVSLCTNSLHLQNTTLSSIHVVDTQ